MTQQSNQRIRWLDSEHRRQRLDRRYRWQQSERSGYLSFSGGGGPSFSETFSLTGLAPATATISGYPTADDSGTLLLNGNPISDLNNWGEGLISFSVPAAISSPASIPDRADRRIG